MRIVIDLQGAQTESRFRGIGRYSLSLSLAIARQRGEHEVIIALNGLFPETLAPIRQAFDGILPQKNIVVWDAVGPAYELHPDNAVRRAISEKIREAFLVALEPDVVLVTSLFEGYGDDAITTIGRFDGSIPTAVILYDLIPLISPDEHFLGNQILRTYYAGKIESLKQSRLLLAISERARLEALTSLQFDQDQVVTVSGAFDDAFVKIEIADTDRADLLKRLGISRPFVFYTGGADDRKNLHRLIEAYAGLSPALRAQYQLVLAGKMPPGHTQSFKDTAARHGLESYEILLPGYVDDADLLKLYNICALFVFPSLHEGFGIPPLEAMSCGAPVIGSHATSLLEVIGLPEAMFDPESVPSIQAKLEEALVDTALRQRLVSHGLVHSKTFTWDRSAKLALKALKRFAPASGSTEQSFNKIVSDTRVVRTSLYESRPLKIAVLKLDHLGDFILAIPALTKLRSRYPQAHIDLIVGSWSVPLAETLKLFRHIYSFDYFRKKSSESASASEQKLTELVGSLAEYDIAIDLRRQRDTRFILDRIPAKLRVGYETFNPKLDARLGVKLASVTDYLFEANALSEVPASIQMARLVEALPHAATDGVDYPVLSARPEPKSNCFAIFPRAGNTVKEWSPASYRALIEKLNSNPAVDRINVYFANEREHLDYPLPHCDKLDVHVGLSMQALTDSLSQNVICIANNSFGVHIGGYLGLLVIGIYGGHETVKEWAPVFGRSYVVHQPVPCSPCHIAQPADCPYALRCLNAITVDDVYVKVDEALQAIESQRLAKQPIAGATLKEVLGATPLKQQLIEAIAGLDLRKLSVPDKFSVSRAIANNHPAAGHRQLFVDISELVVRDAKSGIQRVVRSVLRALVDAPPVGFVVVPVYASMHEQGYRQARNFMRSFLGTSLSEDLVDEPIFYRSGDQFLGLDLHPHVALTQAPSLLQMRAKGVRVQFVVYDLLCAILPQHFVPGSQEAFVRWLRLVAQMDGAVCISNAVAEEYRAWLQSAGAPTSAEYSITRFHLGADIQQSAPSQGLSAQDSALLQQLSGQQNFLMVGTVEPRKAHQLVLDAFDELWKDGKTFNLVIVGKKGWLIDALAERMQQHPEQGKRLFWLASTSDEMLEKIYAVSTCLIFASEGEGFGLPLIEAAQHGLPVIARDLPVFREVADSNAYYFSATTARELAEAVNHWAALFAADQHPKSSGMSRLTWKESTAQLVSAMDLQA